MNAEQMTNNEDNATPLQIRRMYVLQTSWCLAHVVTCSACHRGEDGAICNEFRDLLAAKFRTEMKLMKQCMPVPNSENAQKHGEIPKD